MEINYRQGKSRINFQISVPEGRRKKFRKVQIPLVKGYRVVEMIDDAFIPHSHHWKVENQHYVLDASKLPSSATYRVTVEADVDAAMLGKLVYVRPTLNRDNDEENDNYWLESSIVQPDLLKRIYESLEVNDVDVGVVVDVEKMFGLTIPSEIKQTLDSATRLLEASRRFDRNQLLQAALSYKKQAMRHPLPNPSDFHSIIDRVTDKETITRHIRLDRPYGIDGVDHPQKYAGVVPQSLNVQVSARLTLKSPIAEGYLRFQRKKYMDHLKHEFSKLSKRKKLA